MIHRKIGGSTSARTINCPAWVSRSVNAPKQPGNVYAREGNLLHDVMEDYYMKNLSFEKQLQEGREYEGVVLTEDHFGLLYTSLNALEALLDEHDIQEFYCEPFVEIIPGEVGGSIDFLGVSEDGKTVLLADYKMGMVHVTAENNAQLQFYALAASIDEKTKAFFAKATKIVYAIVQPKCSKDAEVWESTTKELAVFEKAMMKAIDEVNGDNPSAAVGGHCRYCPNSPTCPEKQEQVRSALLIDPKEASKMAEALDLVGQLQSWINEVEGAAHTRMESGALVPGFKLVQKRAMRKWIDASQAEQTLVTLLGELATDTKLKTPAQIEKVIKKEKSEFDLGTITHKVSSGTTVVADSDKREAVVIPQISDALHKLVDGSSK